MGYNCALHKVYLNRKQDFNVAQVAYINHIQKIMANTTYGVGLFQLKAVLSFSSFHRPALS
jgi:hypothetical protein